MPRKTIESPITIRVYDKRKDAVWVFKGADWTGNGHFDVKDNRPVGSKIIIELITPTDVHMVEK